MVFELEAGRWLLEWAKRKTANQIEESVKNAKASMELLLHTNRTQMTETLERIENNK